MKTNLKSFLPAGFSKWYQNHLYRRGIKQGILAEIKGDYPSFGEARQDSGTYDSDAYAELCLKAYWDSRQPRNGPIKDHDWRLLSKVALVLGQGGGLRVLDIGGSSGDYYFKLKNLVGGRAIQKWIVVEAQKVVEKMRGVDPFLEYVSSPEEVVRQNLDINFVFISGTLQYLENPFQVLEALTPFQSDYLCINKSILWNKPTRLMKQITPDSRRSSRPIWIFNEVSLKDKLKSLNYHLLWAYENSELVTYIPGHGSLAYRGLFLKRDEDS